MATKQPKSFRITTNLKRVNDRFVSQLAEEWTE